VKGVTVPLFLEWIRRVIGPEHNQNRRKLLIMDRLQVHINRNVRELLEELNFDIEYFPPKASKDLSPLDNSLFGVFKTGLRQRRYRTQGGKKRACQNVWNGMESMEKLSGICSESVVFVRMMIATLAKISTRADEFKPILR